MGYNGGGVLPSAAPGRGMQNIIFKFGINLFFLICIKDCQEGNRKNNSSFRKCGKTFKELDKTLDQWKNI